MNLQERRQTIEELIMKQAYLDGLQFRVHYLTKDPRYTWKVEFENIAQWQVNQVRQKLFELRMNHIEITGKKITTDPRPSQPRNKRRRKR